MTVESITILVLAIPLMHHQPIFIAPELFPFGRLIFLDATTFEHY